MTIQANHPKNKNRFMKIEVKRAIFLKDVELFSKMDPYCIVRMN